MRMSLSDRLLLLLTGLLAAYEIVVGINDLSTLPILAYTIAFGVLLVAVLLLLLQGFEVLDSPVVVVIATVIPLSLSAGLAWEYAPAWRSPTLIFALGGFLAVLLTRALPMRGAGPILVLTFVHGVAGLVICLLPLVRVFQGLAAPGFALVGAGGALIGLGGLSLSFLRLGRPFLPREAIYHLLPGLLCLMTGCFVAGFYLA